MDDEDRVRADGLLAHLARAGGGGARRRRPPPCPRRAAGARGGGGAASGGRLVLGVGAGWHEAEHQRFGVPFPSLKERMDNYESGLDLILRAWERTRPQPVRAGRVPILLGGRGGEKRGLGIVARFADEW